MILHNTCNQIFSLSADFIWELENQIVCWGEISVIFRRLILRTWLSGGKFKSREENTCVQSFKTICTRQWRDFLNKHYWDIWCDCYFIYDQRKFDSVSLYYTIQEMHSIAAFIFITEDCVDLRFYATGLAGLPPTNYRFISIKSDVIFKFSLGLISLKGHT